MSAAARASNALLQQARLAQVLTVAWMVVEGLVAVGAGIAARSVALTAFGADSAVEIFTALVVLRQLSLPQAAEEIMDERARQASRLVGLGLYGVAVYVVISSAAGLFLGIRAEPSAAGITLAIASTLIMPVLWRWRLGLSERLHSAALRADAACSAVCLYMALTLLVGLALNRLLGWWWADPVAALAMIWWIKGEASEALEAARTGRHCEDC